jgi:hypothetical protein
LDREDRRTCGRRRRACSSGDVSSPTVSFPSLRIS